MGSVSHIHHHFADRRSPSPRAPTATVPVGRRRHLVSAVALPPDDRQETHNTCVDDKSAATGACAQLHVQTGRICVLGHHHAGSCDFVARDRVEASLSERRAIDGR